MPGKKSGGGATTPKKKIRIKRSPAPRTDSPSDYTSAETRKAVDRQVEIDRKRRQKTITARIPTATSAKTPRRKKLTRDEELTLAVDLLLEKEPSFKKSAKKTGLSPLARDYVFGEALSRPGFNPKDPWEFFDLAMMAPFGKPIAGLRAGAVGAGKVLGGKGRREALEAAGREYSGPGLTRRVMRSATEPAARSRLGRAGESLVDRARPVTGKIPGVRSVDQKLGNELKLNEKLEKKLDAAWGTQLKAAGRKLSSEEQYAVRLIGEGVDPETQIGLHTMLSEAAEEGTQKASHRIHAEMYRNASRYVEADETGLRLTADAPDNLKKVVELMQKSGAQREGIYKALNIKTPEQLSARIQKPGQLVTGQHPKKSVENIVEDYPEGTVFHGSPEGLLGKIDTFHHTKPWKEGIGLYLTENYQKASGYARGRTATGNRRATAKEAGKVNAFKISQNAKVLDMEAPADFDFWQDVSKIADFSPRDFQYYVVRQAPPNPTNGQIREELLYQLKDLEGSEAVYSLDEALTTRGIQATSHLEGKKGETLHRVWVIKDASVLESVSPIARTVVSPGEAGFQGGKFYVPDKRGLPIRLRNVRANARAVSSFLGGGKTIGRGAALPANLRKEYTGLLKGSGLWKGNVTDATAEQTFKAVRLSSAKRIRAEFLRVSNDVPKNVDDIAIKIDPSKDASPELRRLFDLMQDMELSARKASLKEMDGLDMSVFGQVLESIFPRVVDGLPAEKKALEMLQSAATQPIDNIRWVSRELIEASEFMSNPQAIMAQQEGWGKFELVGKTADAYNDYVKATLLQLNPQYYTANFVGNIALNVMQQGIFAPINLTKASRLSVKMEVGLANVVDDLMGSGLTRLADFRFGAKTPLNAINRVGSKLVDTVPRRAAFLHEARRLGYKSSKDIEQLLKRAIDEGDEEARKDLIYIARRANDAIIDYERLNPFEKKVVTRIIFIYPWIKGSTRFAIRFPAEHPVQAAAFALLYQRQQELANQELGERPWYADLNVPLGIDVERYGEKYPLTANPKQFIPFTQQYEMARTGEGFVRGIANRQPLIEMFQPLLGNLSAALTGKRAFDNRDVDRDIGTFFTESFAIPWRDRWKALTASDEERGESASNRLYPRNFTDELAKAALGTLAPTPYNPEKGQRLARGQKGPTKKQEWGEKLSSLQEYYPNWKPSPALKSKLDEAIAYKDEWEKVRSKQPKDDGQPEEEREKELVELKLDMLLRLKPEYEPYRERFVRFIEDPTGVGRADSKIEELLGWNELDRIGTLLGEAERKKAKEAFQHGD